MYYSVYAPLSLQSGAASLPTSQYTKNISKDGDRGKQPTKTSASAREAKTDENPPKKRSREPPAQPKAAEIAWPEPKDMKVEILGDDVVRDMKEEEMEQEGGADSVRRYTWVNPYDTSAVPGDQTKPNSISTTPQSLSLVLGGCVLGDQPRSNSPKPNTYQLLGRLSQATHPSPLNAGGTFGAHRGATIKLFLALPTIGQTITMERIPNNDGGPGMNLQAAVGEINPLKAKMIAMEQEKAAEKEEEAELGNIQDSQPLAQALWDAQIPTNFKIPQLPTFEGKTDPLEHLMAVGTQTAIIGAEEHLKCKLLSSTLKDAALRWYMNLPKNSIASYTDFHKKCIHQFVGSKHVQVMAISLFGIRQGHNENLCEYLARFNEATIQVSNPNQEMFVAAVQNERSLPAEDLQSDTTEEAVNGVAVMRIWAVEDTINHGGATKRPIETGKATPCTGQQREDGFNREIDKQWSLEKIPRTSIQGRLEQALAPRSPRRSPPREDVEKEPRRIAINTIAGGFAGGGESRAARKRYLRRIIQETNVVAHISSPKAPEISFPPSDGEGVFPHDDDPLVIQVQILNCDVKRVLIDSGSSADIMYSEAFKAMQLAGEQLQPYNGTLVGFGGEQVEVMGHVTLVTTFGEKENAKTIKVRYLVVKTTFTSYNIIIGRPAFNTLGAVLSTLYLLMKYPLDDGKIGTVRRDQAQRRQRYELSLRLKRNQAPADRPIISRVNMIGRANMVKTSDLDPREEFQDRMVSPIDDLEYGADVVIPAEVDQPSWRRATLTAEVNSEALKENLDLLEEVREVVHFRELMVKQRASRKYNTRVMAREFREGDLVLKRLMGRNKGGKLAPNWEGPYRIKEAFGGGAYRLETLKGETLPRAWNVINLRFYYS
ncbi:hypothetical protein TSUD_402540 [Trifolium subterraneum]|uniref:Retrotransposon gag domain-containing protein n=1 Tax=Trifolium subterraneum TaxID=3900 RepID=A0A2Z6NQK8_TRISU|nr:hypothetical protein TSUD_402540 [Trifolium subterraneum]